MRYAIKFTDTTEDRYFAGVFWARTIAEAKTWKTRKAAEKMLPHLIRPAVVIEIEEG